MTAARLLALLIVAGFAIVRPSIASRAPDHDVRGRVYAAPAAPRPVVGASVSSDSGPDWPTTTTNDAGEFRLRVRRVADDEYITLKVAARGRVVCRRLLGSTRGPVLLFLDQASFRSAPCQ